jgi:hypothetical protein
MRQSDPNRRRAGSDAVVRGCSHGQLATRGDLKMPRYSGRMRILWRGYFASAGLRDAHGRIGGNLIMATEAKLLAGRHIPITNTVRPGWDWSHESNRCSPGRMSGYDDITSFGGGARSSGPGLTRAVVGPAVPPKIRVIRLVRTRRNVQSVVRRLQTSNRGERNLTPRTRPAAARLFLAEGPTRDPRTQELTMFFLSRIRYGPFIYVGLGVALIIFALVVTSASRLVLVVGGVAIVAGLANGIARLRTGGRDSGRGAPGR